MSIKTAPPDTLIEILQTAAAFQDHEWTQHAHGRDANGEPSLNFLEGTTIQFCAEGHLLRAVKKHAATDFSLKPMYAALDDLLPEPADLIEWNDAPERRPEEVRELFRQAIAVLTGGKDPA